MSYRVELNVQAFKCQFRAHAYCKFNCFVQTTVASCYAQFLLSYMVPFSCLPPDSTFTFPNVVVAVATVQNSDILGAWLGVPACKRVSKETVVNYLVSTTAVASWEKLSGVLYFLEEHAALDETTKYFQRQPGMCMGWKCLELATVRICIVHLTVKTYEQM